VWSLTPTGVADHFTTVVLPRIYQLVGVVEERAGPTDTPCSYYELARTAHSPLVQLFLICHWLTVDDEYARMMIPLETKRINFLHGLRRAMYCYSMKMDWYLPSPINPFPGGIRAIPGPAITMDHVIRFALIDFAWR